MVAQYTYADPFLSELKFWQFSTVICWSRSQSDVSDRMTARRRQKRARQSPKDDLHGWMAHTMKVGKLISAIIQSKMHISGGPLLGNPVNGLRPPWPFCHGVAHPPLPCPIYRPPDWPHSWPFSFPQHNNITTFLCVRVAIPLIGYEPSFLTVLFTIVIRIAQAIPSFLF